MLLEYQIRRNLDVIITGSDNNPERPGDSVGAGLLTDVGFTLFYVQVDRTLTG